MKKIKYILATIAMLFVFNLVPTQKMMAQPCGSIIAASAPPSAIMHFSGWLSTDTKFGVDAYVTCVDPYYLINAEISDGINLPTSLYYTDATNPSVALFEYGTTVYAVVAYISSTGGGYCYDIFSYAGLGGYTLSSGGNVLEALSTGPLVPGIRINSDLNGYGVIVWSDWTGVIGTGLWTATIWTNYSSIYPTIATGPSLMINGCYDGDVAVNYPDVFYSYGYTGSFAFVAVAQAGWLTPLSYIGLWSTYPSGEIRIACNNAYNPLSQHDWTAVYNIGNQMWGQTSIGGSLQPAQEYTSMYPNCTADLSTSPQSNFMPVVSYSPDYQSMTSGGIVVGWNYSTITNSPITMPDSLSVIALNCKHDGSPINDYWMVVPPVSGTPPFPNVQWFLELTGRDQPMGASILYAWDDYSGSLNIDSKRVPWNASSLRTENTGEENKMLSGIYPNPSNGNFMIHVSTEVGEMVNIEIYNAMGQKVYSSLEESTSTTYSKEVTLKNYDAGIYFVREVGTVSNNNWKIILTN